MKILIISSEALPWSKTGGLGDVSYALSNALAKLGHQVKLFIPATKSNLEQFSKPNIKLEPTPKSSISCQIYLHKASASEEHYLIANKKYLTRDGVYGDDNNPYSDNCSRFSFFCQAALNTVIALNWKPDIVHSHDWPTALIPLYLKTNPWKSFFKKSKSFFSIHNLGYQGEFSLRAAHDTALPGKLIPLDPHDNSKINLMAGAIKHANQITTVSPSYAKEILIDDLSHGLSEQLQQRQSDLNGIVNGIDTTKWNPEKDSLIPQNFSLQDLKGKSICKKEILKEFGLKGEDKPLIAMITRLANQKGINQAFHPESGAIAKICKVFDINLIVVGTGEQWCEDELQRLNDELINFKALITFNEALSHRVEAGSDFFLMPSLYEPCGLNQMYSSRYGTIPIVRHTGGLADTVTPYQGDATHATGYSFFDLTPEAIYGTVKYALETYYHRKTDHRQIISNGMKLDFSWENSAKKVEILYKKTISQ